MNAIITGSGRGIGKEIAREVCRRGGYFYGFSRYWDVDVTDYECLHKAFAGLAEVELFPDVLINNAGIVEMGTVLELSPESWKKQFDVNLNGVFYCCKEYIKLLKLKKRQGKIINIASTSGMLTPRPGRSAYAASKAAVISLSLSLSEELKQDHIQVYCIAPGACNTDLRKQIYPDDDFENMMQPEELAKFVVDIAENGYMMDNQVIIARGH